MERRTRSSWKQNAPDKGSSNITNELPNRKSGNAAPARRGRGRGRGRGRNRQEILPPGVDSPEPFMRGIPSTEFPPDFAPGPMIQLNSPHDDRFPPVGFRNFGPPENMNLGYPMSLGPHEGNPANFGPRPPFGPATFPGEFINCGPLPPGLPMSHPPFGAPPPIVPLPPDIPPFPPPNVLPSIPLPPDLLRPPMPAEPIPLPQFNESEVPPLPKSPAKQLTTNPEIQCSFPDPPPTSGASEHLTERFYELKQGVKKFTPEPKIEIGTSLRQIHSLPEPTTEPSDVKKDTLERYSPSKQDDDEEADALVIRPKVWAKGQAKKRLMAFSISKMTPAASTALKKLNKTPKEKPAPPKTRHQLQNTVDEIEKEKKLNAYGSSQLRTTALMEKMALKTKDARAAFQQSSGELRQSRRSRRRSESGGRGRSRSSSRGRKKERRSRSRSREGKGGRSSGGKRSSPSPDKTKEAPRRQNSPSVEEKPVKSPSVDRNKDNGVSVDKQTECDSQSSKKDESDEKENVTSQSPLTEQKQEGERQERGKKDRSSSRNRDSDRKGKEEKKTEDVERGKNRYSTGERQRSPSDEQKAEKMKGRDSGEKKVDKDRRKERSASGEVNKEERQRSASDERKRVKGRYSDRYREKSASQDRRKDRGRDADTSAERRKRDNEDLPKMDDQMFADWKGIKAAGITIDTSFRRRKLFVDGQSDQQKAPLKPRVNYLEPVKKIMGTVPVSSGSYDEPPKRYYEKAVRFTETKPTIQWSQIPVIHDDRYYMSRSFLLANTDENNAQLFLHIADARETQFKPASEEKVTERKWYPKEEGLISDEDEFKESTKDDATTGMKESIKSLLQYASGDESPNQVQVKTDGNTFKVKSKWDSDNESSPEPEKKVKDDQAAQDASTIQKIKEHEKAKGKSADEYKARKDKRTSGEPSAMGLRRKSRFDEESPSENDSNTSKHAQEIVEKNPPREGTEKGIKEDKKSLVQSSGSNEKSSDDSGVKPLRRSSRRHSSANPDELEEEALELKKQEELKRDKKKALKRESLPQRKLRERNVEKLDESLSKSSSGKKGSKEEKVRRSSVVEPAEEGIRIDVEKASSKKDKKDVLKKTQDREDENESMKARKQRERNSSDGQHIQKPTVAKTDDVNITLGQVPVIKADNRRGSLDTCGIALPQESNSAESENNVENAENDKLKSSVERDITKRQEPVPEERRKDQRRKSARESLQEELLPAIGVRDIDKSQIKDKKLNDDETEQSTESDVKKKQESVAEKPRKERHRREILDDPSQHNRKGRDIEEGYGKRRKRESSKDSSMERRRKEDSSSSEEELEIAQKRSKSSVKQEKVVQDMALKTTRRGRNRKGSVSDEETQRNASFEFDSKQQKDEKHELKRLSESIPLADEKSPRKLADVNHPFLKETSPKEKVKEPSGRIESFRNRWDSLTMPAGIVLEQNVGETHGGVLKPSSKSEESLQKKVVEIKEESDRRLDESKIKTLKIEANKPIFDYEPPEMVAELELKKRNIDKAKLEKKERRRSKSEKNDEKISLKSDLDEVSEALPGIRSRHDPGLTGEKASTVEWSKTKELGDLCKSPVTPVVKNAESTTTHATETPGLSHFQRGIVQPLFDASWLEDKSFEVTRPSLLSQRVCRGSFEKEEPRELVSEYEHFLKMVAADEEKRAPLVNEPITTELPSGKAKKTEWDRESTSQDEQEEKSGLKVASIPAIEIPAVGKESVQEMDLPLPKSPLIAASDNIVKANVEKVEKDDGSSEDSDGETSSESSSSTSEDETPKKKKKKSLKKKSKKTKKNESSSGEISDSDDNSHKKKKKSAKHKSKKLKKKNFEKAMLQELNERKEKIIKQLAELDTKKSEKTFFKQLKKLEKKLRKTKKMSGGLKVGRKKRKKEKKKMSSSDSDSSDGRMKKKSKKKKAKKKSSSSSSSSSEDEKKHKKKKRKKSSKGKKKKTDRKRGREVDEEEVVEVKKQRCEVVEAAEKGTAPNDEGSGWEDEGEKGLVAPVVLAAEAPSGAWPQKRAHDWEDSDEKEELKTKPVELAAKEPKEVPVVEQTEVRAFESIGKLNAFDSCIPVVAARSVPSELYSPTAVESDPSKESSDRTSSSGRTVSSESEISQVSVPKVSPLSYTDWDKASPGRKLVLEDLEVSSTLPAPKIDSQPPLETMDRTTSDRGAFLASFNATIPEEPTREIETKTVDMICNDDMVCSNPVPEGGIENQTPRAEIPPEDVYDPLAVSDMSDEEKPVTEAINYPLPPCDILGDIPLPGQPALADILLPGEFPAAPAMPPSVLPPMPVSFGVPPMAVLTTAPPQLTAHVVPIPLGVPPVHTSPIISPVIAVPIAPVKPTKAVLPDTTKAKSSASRSRRWDKPTVIVPVEELQVLVKPELKMTVQPPLPISEVRPSTPTQQIIPNSPQTLTPSPRTFSVKLQQKLQSKVASVFAEDSDEDSVQLPPPPPSEVKPTIVDNKEETIKDEEKTKEVVKIAPAESSSINIEAAPEIKREPSAKKEAEPSRQDPKRGSSHKDDRDKKEYRDKGVKVEKDRRDDRREERPRHDDRVRDRRRSRSPTRRDSKRHSRSPSDKRRRRSPSPRRRRPPSPPRRRRPDSPKRRRSRSRSRSPRDKRPRRRTRSRTPVQQATRRSRSRSPEKRRLGTPPVEPRRRSPSPRPPTRPRTPENNPIPVIGQAPVPLPQPPQRNELASFEKPPDTPQRLSLDQRIELELGVKLTDTPPPAPPAHTENPPPMYPSYGPPQPPMYPMHSDQRILMHPDQQHQMHLIMHREQPPMHIIMHPDQPPMIPGPFPMHPAMSMAPGPPMQWGSPIPAQVQHLQPPQPPQVLQVGNIMEVVPSIHPPPPPPPPPPAPKPQQQIVQVGNVLQVVPSARATAVVAPTPVPQEPPQMTAADVLQNPLIKAIQAEREKRLKEKEGRKKEREARRRIRQAKREAKLMTVAEKLKKSVRNEGLMLGQDPDEEELLLEAMEPPSPPGPVEVVVEYQQPPVAAKGILISPSLFKQRQGGEKKGVKFADGILPGEASTSGGEDRKSPPPKQKIAKEKRLKKKMKRKVKVHVIRQVVGSEEDEDDLPPPPPPPGDPPPILYAAFPFGGQVQYPVYQTSVTTTTVTTVQYPKTSLQ